MPRFFIKRICLESKNSDIQNLFSRQLIFGMIRVVQIRITELGSFSIPFCALYLQIL